MNRFKRNYAYSFAFEQLAHMKGGPSIECFIGFSFRRYFGIAAQAAEVLKTQVFLYEADMERLEVAYNKVMQLRKHFLKVMQKQNFLRNYQK